jgi:hypothetical protein
MARLTITLSDSLHRALKEAAARRGSTIGELIGESLELYGIKGRQEAEELVARAREASGLSEADALALARRETRAARSR